MFVWREPCAPRFLMTLLLQSLIAWILKRIYLGRTSTMGFDWLHRTLLWSLGGMLAPCWLCPLTAPRFLLLGILVGGPWIQKRIYCGGACHMGFGRQPCTLFLSLLSSGGSSALPFGPTHGGSSFSSSPSGLHHGGSSFSSSPVGDMRSMGSSYLPPCLGGSASLAIPPSVSCEDQGVSSLAAPRLTVVRALPLMVDLHPSLLGFGQAAVGGAAPPPCSHWVLSCSVYCPCPVCSYGACVSSSPSFDWSYTSSS